MDRKDLTFLDGLKRVTIFAGHYGSGKTNIAINYALAISEKNFAVDIADLDIVNPYFRTKDAKGLLEERGIRLVSSVMANTNVDTPALPAEAYSIVHDKSKHAVIDVGGDDRGALALGRYVPYLLEENNYEMLFVINKYRYLSSTPEETLEIMREIELAAGMRFTGIVNNSNIGDETCVCDVTDSLAYADRISEATGLPIRFTAVKEELFEEFYNEINNGQKSVKYAVMPIKICVRQTFR